MKRGDTKMPPKNSVYPILALQSVVFNIRNRALGLSILRIGFVELRQVRRIFSVYSFQLGVSN